MKNGDALMRYIYDLFQNFFKLTEGLKLKDPDFKEQMKRL